ncbi:MAG: hypothetical protein IKZ97_06175, partial [Butyrivibrio sp.]|nr:hypothetical protein [Butyrivibrio sp.]
FVYAVYIISSVLVMISDIMGLSKDFSHILKLQVYGELFFQIALILGAALMGFAYYVLIRIVSKYGIKNERITYEKPVPFFILPAGLMLISVLIRIIGCVVGGYFRSEMLFSLIPIIILTVPALLFIGLFYYHDSIEEA